MSRSVPNINAVAIESVSQLLDGSTVTLTIGYRVGWASQNPTIFHRAPSVTPWTLGTGAVTITAAQSTTVESLQIAALQQIITAEQLTTGDLIIQPGDNVYAVP